MRFVRVIAAVGMVSVVAGAGAFAQNPVEPGAAQQHAQTLLKTCFECHGEGGVSRLPTRPTIAGQRADYLLRQLLAFRRAAEAEVMDQDQDADNPKPGAMRPQMRFDPIMAHMIEGVDAQTIAQIGQILSQMPCDAGKARRTADPSQPPQPPKAAARCVACHGEDGMARQAGVPNLAGQQPAYLRRQLLLIRETAYGAQPRENENWRSHPIMEREAGRISIEDVVALAHYYAALDCRGGK